jgi:hypothetical protein
MSTLIRECYTGDNDMVHASIMTPARATVINLDLDPIINLETPALLDPSLTDFPEEQDGFDSETTSSVDEGLYKQGIDDRGQEDFDLGGDFGLAEDNPFLVLEQALFAEMCGENKLSGE